MLPASGHFKQKQKQSAVLHQQGMSSTIKDTHLRHHLAANCNRHNHHYAPVDSNEEPGDGWTVLSVSKILTLLSIYNLEQKTIEVFPELLSHK